MDLKKPVFSLVVLIALLFVLSAISWDFAGRRSTSEATPSASSQSDAKGVRIPPPMPAPAASDMVAGQNAQGFKLLVSYANDGFEPQRATVRAGDTVRFTNNSTRQLWIAANATAGPLYPNVQNGCGSSALDSCRTLAPGEYWQFTFVKAGTWSYQNNLNKDDAGTVRVQ